jgi:hypothetical protein
MDERSSSPHSTSLTPLPSNAPSNAPANAPSNAPAIAVDDTVPGAPAPARIDDDDRHRALLAYARDARAFLADRAWDNLAHVERFAHAASLAKPLLLEWNGAAERRSIAHELNALLPSGARAHSFAPFVDDVGARAPDYRIFPGDVPRIAPVYGDFLAKPDVVDQLVAPGALVLAPKSACPGAARGTATAIVVDAVSDGRVRGRAPMARLGLGDVDADVRLGPDGKPILGVDGKAEPISLPIDVVTSWMFSAGPDARGLDLRSEDDRALLLAYAFELRRREVRGRSAYAWLEDGGAPQGVRVDVVSTCIAAAIDVVAKHAIDPLSCRISLREDGGDGDWQRRAAAFLDETGMFRDVLPRARSTMTPPTSSLAPAPLSSSIARDIVWLDAIARTGFAAGRLSALAAGRAFARLATSMLAPLGVLPMSGLRDGSGAVVLQRILPDVDERVRLDAPALVSFSSRARPLLDAWRDGEGLALPEPKGAPRHDVAAMPAWLAFFLEGLAS